MASLPSAPPEVIKHTAPLLFGFLANWWLHGVLCVQTYVYSYNFPDDKRTVKALAYFVFLLETVQTIMTGADTYYWFIEGYGVLERLQESHLTPIDIPLIEAVISLIVQEYFCYRIWTLTRNPWLCIAIGTIAIVQFIGCFWGGMASLVVGKYIVSKVALYLWTIPSAAVDILIAGSMIYLLRRVRDQGSRFSNHALVRVVRLVVETNALTAGVAIGSLTLFLSFPNEIYYVFTSGIIGKLYSNALLVSLNNRIYFRDHPIAATVIVDSEHAVSSDQSPRFAHFSQVHPPTRAKTTDEGFKLRSIPNRMGLGESKGDEASISSGPSNS
ncbi:hypothetical protein BGW80DRAFT_1453845 [Lactifluus volemus]|nr:hypothetical protein BGW80DRAFT_1453845 [Lactifluus volemus]